MPAPLLLAPVGVQSIVHPDAELAVGRAAAALGLTAILSTAASNTIEDVAEAMGQASRWYQLYWPKDRELAASFVARAERAGYGAIVVTLDTWMLGWRPRDLQNAYLPFLKGEGIANYLSDPVFRAALERPPEEDPGAAIGHWAYQFSNPSRDVGGPRVAARADRAADRAEGHPARGRRAARARRGRRRRSSSPTTAGRQVDGAIGALDALPGVREAVGREFPLLFDSGIRTGADVLKALALGADACCLGRPFVWGLALDGQAGVEHVLRWLLGELDLSLALSGYTSVEQLDASALRRSRLNARRCTTVPRVRRLDEARTKQLTLVATIMGSGIALLDGTVVNVALPTIQRSLGGGLAGQQWVSNAYLLTLGSLILIGGSLGDLFGERRIFALGVLGFGGASLLCAIAPSIGFLIAARALQGVASALLTPASLAVIVRTFPESERGTAIGSWTAWGTIAGVLGPLPAASCWRSAPGG